MNVTLITVGSRGDVQPYVALGLGLKAAGFQVRLATHDVFGDWIRGHGLDFAPVGGNPREMLETAVGRNWLDSGKNPFKLLRYFIDLAKPSLEESFHDSWKACQGSDIIISALLALSVGYHVAEKLNVPHVAALLQPFNRTRAFPAVGVPQWAWAGSVYNWLSHFATEKLLWIPFRGLINEWRQESLGLPPLSLGGPLPIMLAQKQPILYGYSPSLLPKPPDWEKWLHVTGYWFLDESRDWVPPADLADFLVSGTKPLYIGFGSMTDQAPEMLLAMILDALEKTGQRAILLSGWAGLQGANLPETVFPVESVPHDWLFERVTAVIHHGGAGTTAAGLRAGVPSILVPYFADQYFWGRYVTEAGVGPTPVPRNKLTANRLAAAIEQAVTDEEMQQKAAALGEQVYDEEGVETAVKLIAQWIGRKL